MVSGRVPVNPFPVTSNTAKVVISKSSEGMDPENLLPPNQRICKVGIDPIWEGREPSSSLLDTENLPGVDV